jgi:hypothetical protein
VGTFKRVREEAEAGAWLGVYLNAKVLHVAIRYELLAYSRPSHAVLLAEIVLE